MAVEYYSGTASGQDIDNGIETIKEIMESFADGDNGSVLTKVNGEYKFVSSGDSASFGDMYKEDYDPDNSVADAGGIAQYIEEHSGEDPVAYFTYGQPIESSLIQNALDSGKIVIVNNSYLAKLEQYYYVRQDNMYFYFGSAPIYDDDIEYPCFGSKIVVVMYKKSTQNWSRKELSLLNKNSQASKTSGMTQEVGVDSNGKLWVPPGSSGGSSDYADLENKPKINNVELSGNKTLSDLGIAASSDLSGKINKSAQATKTSAMTQAVGIDNNGKLWVPSGGGSGSGDMLKSVYDSNNAVANAGGIAQYVAQHGGGGGSSSNYNLLLDPYFRIANSHGFTPWHEGFSTIEYIHEEPVGLNDPVDYVHIESEDSFYPVCQYILLTPQMYGKPITLSVKTLDGEVHSSSGILTRRNDDILLPEPIYIDDMTIEVSIDTWTFGEPCLVVKIFGEGGEDAL